MNKLHTDQASGLRRMLGDTQVRKFLVLSAITAPQKYAVMSNLGAALAQQGAEVLLLAGQAEDAHGIGQHFSRCPTSIEVIASSKKPLENAMVELGHGVCGAVLHSAGSGEKKALSSADLDRVVAALTKPFNVWLVDATDDTLPALNWPALQDCTVLLLSACHATSMQKAYAMIENLHQRRGKHTVQLLVYAATPEQAQQVHQKIAHVVGKRLATPVLALGHLPIDEHLARAMQMERPVTEAFALSASAQAFKTMARRLMSPSIAPQTKSVSFAGAHAHV